MENVNVLIAGSGNITGINVIRAIAKDVPLVVGTDCDYENPANKFCQNYVVPRAAHPDYMPTIMEIAKKRRITHIIASNDHEVRALSKHIDELQKENIIFNGFGINTLNCLNKEQTAKLFYGNNITTPDVLNDIDFPCVIRKNNVGDRQKFVFIVKSKQEMPAVDLREAIITRYVKGDEYTIDILCDNESNALSVVPRLRRKVQGGMVHFAEIVKDNSLINKATELAKTLSLKGINCVQCIENEENTGGGVNSINHYFTEINPRPGSGLDLTINAGVNMPLLWIKQTCGKEIKVAEPLWGMKMLRYYDGYYYK
jgi:carbamoyl-phosphate synthase large subunit